MATGKVKWFDNRKGFGFVISDEGGADLFVHHTDIVGKGYKVLNEGQRVTFTKDDAGKGPKAREVAPA